MLSLQNSAEWKEEGYSCWIFRVKRRFNQSCVVTQNHERSRVISLNPGFKGSLMEWVFSTFLSSRFKCHFALEPKSRRELQKYSSTIQQPSKQKYNGSKEITKALVNCIWEKGTFMKFVQHYIQFYQYLV